MNNINKKLNFINLYATLVRFIISKLTVYILTVKLCKQMIPKRIPELF